MPAEYRGKNVPAEVVGGIRSVILLKEIVQETHREHIDAHGGERAVGITQNAPRVLRLLMKGHDPVVLIHRHDAEGARLIEADGQTGDGHFGPGLVVVLQHRAVVHPVDVISGQDERIRGAATLQQVKILVDGVRGTRVPGFSGPHLRRNQRDVFLQFGVVDGPPVTQMLLQ